MKVFDIVLAAIRAFGVIALIREAWSPALAVLGPLCRKTGAANVGFRDFRDRAQLQLLAHC